MQEYDVYFERTIDGESKVGKSPVEAPSEDDAEIRFLTEVEDADGEFVVFDVQRAT